MPDEPLVIALRSPRLAGVEFPAMSALLAGGALAWMAAAPSWQAVASGGGLVLGIAWLWTTVLAARRRGGGEPPEIVVTREGLRSPLWSLDWERIDRVLIGRAHSGAPRSLTIEPLGAGARTPGGAPPPIRIFAQNVDRTLDELAAELERRAGRALLVD